MPIASSDAPYFSVYDKIGILGESNPSQFCPGGGLVGTAGRLELVRIRVPQAGLCTNIKLFCSTVGASMTAGQNFAALFHALGGLIAPTADQSVAWVSTGMKSMALQGGPYLLTASDYYVGFWSNGSTLPQFARFGNFTGILPNVGFVAPNMLYATANTGLTTTAPSAFGTQTQGSAMWWAALGSDASTS